MRTICLNLLERVSLEICTIQSLKLNRFEDTSEILDLLHHELSNIKGLYLQHASQLTDDDRIYFFKEVKPTLLSEYIYYQHLQDFATVSNLPSHKMIKKKYMQCLKHIELFMYEHHHLYNYYLQNQTLCDLTYFGTPTTSHQSFYLPPLIGFDFTWSSKHDKLWALFMAYEKLLLYIRKQLMLLDNLSVNGTKLLQWTGPKVALVELVYALYLQNFIDHGQIGLTELSRHLSQLFHIDLHQIQRTFSEIEQRKHDRTKFLHQLIRGLEQYMDQKNI